MPAPFGGDNWLSGRHFGIVIDAGSSGSRLQIYSWRSPASVIAESGKNVPHILPQVEKGAREGEEWSIKIEPGISTFGDDPHGVTAYLRPLLDHAREQIPPSRQPDTPLFLLATAGMRLLESQKQAAILKETCTFLSLHSHFKIDAPSSDGPCGKSVQIITGEEEGLFGWIAVNYLMDGFGGSREKPTTFGFLDMGGASTQIAFEPAKEHQSTSQNLIPVSLRLLSGEEIVHKVFVTTWLGYGTNKARERYVGKTINEFETSRSHDNHSDIVPDPCLPKDLLLTEQPFQTEHVAEHNSKTHQLVGTGSFEQCMKKTAPLLNKGAPCPDVPCLMNGVHVPTIDFSVSHFIGVSEYWYSSEHVFGLGGAYDFVQYELAASEFCSQDWDSIMAKHTKDKAQKHLGGDGEVVKDGQVVEVGKWNDEVELSRLRMQCFKAAWIANVLHEGIGMPRIVDPGGNSTPHGDDVAEQADKKGLGRPTFQSVDTVHDIAISWTLGKMVLEASKEVPLPSRYSKPVVDPIDNIPDSSNSPIHPIRPFFNLESLESKLTPHLPTSLHRASLGFSPVLFLFWTVIFFVLFLVAWPMRRRLKLLCLRVVRKPMKRDLYAYSMEEGHALTGLNGHAHPPNSWLDGLMRPFSRTWSAKKKTPRSSNLSLMTVNGAVGAGGGPSRISPTRSYSLPNVNALTITTVGTSTATSSRSSSPLPSPKFNGQFADVDLGLGGGGNGDIGAAATRSRNTSQMNLSSLASRGAISRISSLSGNDD
ncbi:nucleoside phosphatase family-domain-containing protein [Flagelloscypha sp. PMI_526]|nr:nucleoside phosphatase family-domain-containing protein [Flagelloscypha sp. PMI_526]